jgi:hypothetical protein
MDYEPFDQADKLGPYPHDDRAALDAWEVAHGHDVRLKCYVEFGCQVIEPALERRIEELEAERDKWRGKAENLLGGYSQHLIECPEGRYRAALQVIAETGHFATTAVEYARRVLADE